jgi:type IX secretion system PorP/SprF family membrane protein
MLSSGLNFGLGFRSVDFNRLVFYDQLEFDSNNSNIPSDDPSAFRLGNTTYFDFGAGGLIYSRKVWLGFTASHLNNPNRSLIGEEAEIPMKMSVHGGVRIPLYQGLLKRDKVAAIMPSFVYKQQGKFDQLDIGTYFFYEPVVVGLWYRGIPIQQNARDNISQDAVVVVLGFQLEKLELSYSYDLTVSELGPIGGGAHEVALKYHIDVVKGNRKKKPEKYIPCPTFNR